MKEMKKINGDEPATQAELAMWGGRLTERIDELESRMATKDDLKQLKDEILRHFNAAVENIEDDLKGANQDEISALKDTDTKLHERVTVIETRLGIPTPPSS